MNISFNSEKYQSEIDKKFNINRIKQNENEYPEDDQVEHQIEQPYETESQLGDHAYQLDVLDEKSIQLKNYQKKFEASYNNTNDDELSSEDDDFEVLEKPPIHHIIIDCSTLNYIDTFGVKILNQVSF